MLVPLPWHISLNLAGGITLTCTNKLVITKSPSSISSSISKSFIFAAAAGIIILSILDGVLQSRFGGLLSIYLLLFLPLNLLSSVNEGLATLAPPSSPTPPSLHTEPELLLGESRSLLIRTLILPLLGMDVFTLD